MYQIEVGSGYGRAEWCDDLRAALRLAGGKAKPLALLLTDNQIGDDAMLEDLCHLLSGGEVPNLFDVAEQVRSVQTCFCEQSCCYRQCRNAGGPVPPAQQRRSAEPV